jgi:hypothetical protein
MLRQMQMLITEGNIYLNGLPNRTCYVVNLMLKKLKLLTCVIARGR